MIKELKEIVNEIKFNCYSIRKIWAHLSAKNRIENFWNLHWEKNNNKFEFPKFCDKNEKISIFEKINLVL